MPIKENVEYEIRKKKVTRATQGSKNGAGNKNIVARDRKEPSRFFLFSLRKQELKAKEHIE